MRVVGPLDHNFGWDGEHLLSDADLAPGSPLPPVLRGAAALAAEGADGWRLLRDPLGLNKLFWAPVGDGIALAARPKRLIAEGARLDEVSAIPRGTAVDLPGPEPISLVPDAWSSPDPLEPEAAATAIRGKLDSYLAALAAANGQAPVYVCLSGGLDSSGIATLASSHFENVTAVSFDLVSDRGEPSEDRLAAERVARDLNVGLLCADVDVAGLLGHLDTVLVEGIDWRDFNVHAALVNAVLGQAIADASDAEQPLVLTGDLPNEFLVDYHAEHHGGETFYELPRLPPAALRAALVRGLDSCHREIGVFESFGLRLVQPYAVAVDAYLSLSAEFLALADRKERLCREIFGERLPSFVLERPKARAQTGGDEGGGVLGACLDNGIDSDRLKGRFAELHEVDDPAALDRFVRAGRYRSVVPEELR